MSKQVEFTVSAKPYRTGTRVWIEGKRLSDAGWFWGLTQYSQYIGELDNGRECIVLVKGVVEDADKVKTVAGRNRGGKEYPILDLTGEAITRVMNGAERALVTLDEEQIIIEPSQGWA